MKSLHGGFPKLGVPSGVPMINKDYRMSRSTLGSPYIGKLPNTIAKVVLVMVALVVAAAAGLVGGATTPL